ncbi:MAG: flagellar motor switch phosphatase FliY [Firmicutes bacterium]|jgi:flagellar motor switch protein FliN/FliY|nr:flagellar motor switch phosphatase FliY [Bacillota bacterium]
MSDFLSQEEIDALLRGAAGGDSDNGNDDETAQEPLGSQDAPGEDGDIQSHQLDELLDELERDTLAEVGNISMGAAATALSAILDRKVAITVPTVTLTSREEVQTKYPIPCLVIAVNYVEGLEGSNLLVIQERDAAVIASLMMGEDGLNPPEVLTDLHVSAVTEAMNQMMGSSATSMSDMFGTRIQISPPDVEQLNLAAADEALQVTEPVVQVAFRLQVDGLIDSEMLQLIELDFARNTVARLLSPDAYMAGGPAVEQEITPTTAADEVAAVKWDEADLGSVGSQPPWHYPPGEGGGLGYGLGDLGNLNIELIRNIPVKVRAILGRSRLPIETILRLGPGSIVELDTLDGEPIEILANDVLIAKGEVVVVGEQFGVRLTEISTPKERISTVW